MTANPTIVLTGLTVRSEPVLEATIRDLADRVDGDRSSAFVGSLLTDVAADGATHLNVISGDGTYRASIPLEAIRDGARLIVGSTSSLDASAGGPFRFLVEDGRTLCWNVKDVGEMRFTDGPEPDNVPERPTH